MVSLLKRILGSRNDRLLKQCHKLLLQINSHECFLASLSNIELTAKTQAFRERYQAGTSLDSLLPEAFAVVRESSKRVFGMRHFDSQMLGGITLHQGKIAEMRTGEGKTLMATLAVYLNAIASQGVHVVTVNDYLARRDAQGMGRLYNFLGMTVGVVVPQQSNEEKKAAYAADITYGTNNEFGFDYLRDNMEYCVEDRRQRELSFAIVDEVDSILIDEARTPLIISGQAEDHTDLYIRMNAVPRLLVRMTSEPKLHESEPVGDFWVDEKNQQVHISEAGHEHSEEILTRLALLPQGESLYEPRHIALMHHLMVALRANNLFFRDQQYVVQNNEVIIVDEFTGRLMVGRRWSDGLHQAIEAKEGVKVQHENQTLASITFQNYFRMYDKLSGMTGTADTEAYEFQEIYSLETVIIPTNKPMIRRDQNDQIFKTYREKYDAILQDIRDCYQRGQPVLVGTTSIENSELLANLLIREKLPHEVLNAKQHAREADIVAEAGKGGHITIATNMAGRGTDIVLGGGLEKLIEEVRNSDTLSDEQRDVAISEMHVDWKRLNEEVKAAGGLRIIGTERHESRRIDNQLRGRAGRQGDPGSTRFYLSLEDSLMRIFAGDRVRAIMERLKLPDGEPIEASMVSRSIETAQRKVEARNFDIRKQLLEYDDVANDQRKVIYSQRNDVLESKDIHDIVDSLRISALTEVFYRYVPAESIEEQWDIAALESTLRADWKLNLSLTKILEDSPTLNDNELLNLVLKVGKDTYQAKMTLVNEASRAQFERSILLQTIDSRWREHLSSLDFLRQGIHLRGYAQKNPKQEYKREAFDLFTTMLDSIRDDAVRLLLTVDIQSPAEAEAAVDSDISLHNIQHHHSKYNEELDNKTDKTAHTASVRNPMKRVGRNEVCPCGSGKKYKKCHGALT